MHRPAARGASLQCGCILIEANGSGCHGNAPVAMATERARAFLSHRHTQCLYRTCHKLGGYIWSEFTLPLRHFCTLTKSVLLARVGVRQEYLFIYHLLLARRLWTADVWGHPRQLSRQSTEWTMAKHQHTLRLRSI